MVRIGLLSDTHGYLDDRIVRFFETCDEIWHAGDIGSIEVAERLAAMKPLRAVHGNIDNQDISAVYPETLRFTCEATDVYLKHIGGYPGNYDHSVKDLLKFNPPDLFICGHSHILKILNDKKLGLLHINPGAAGRIGLHKKQTAVRFVIDNIKISNCEVLDLDRK